MVSRMHMNLEFIVYLRNERWNQRNQDGKTALSAVKGGVCTSAPVAGGNSKPIYRSRNAVPHTYSYMQSHVCISHIRTHTTHKMHT